MVHIIPIMLGIVAFKLVFQTYSWTENNFLSVVLESCNLFTYRSAGLCSDLERA